MKVKYFMKYSSGEAYPWAESDMVSDDIDLIELLLSSDVDSKTKVREFKDTVFKKKETWWFNATKVEVSGGLVTISPAFDTKAVVKLDIQVMKAIIADWESFLGIKAESMKEYKVRC